MLYFLLAFKTICGSHVLYKILALIFKCEAEHLPMIFYIQCKKFNFIQPLDLLEINVKAAIKSSVPTPYSMLLYSSTSQQFLEQQCLFMYVVATPFLRSFLVMFETHLHRFSGLRHLPFFSYANVFMERKTWTQRIMNKDNVQI